MKKKLKILLFGVFFIFIILYFNYNDKEKLDVKVDLPDGLTPVIYKNNKWKVIDKNNNKWYDYSKQKWANAVILKNKKKWRIFRFEKGCICNVCIYS